MGDTWQVRLPIQCERSLVPVVMLVLALLGGAVGNAIAHARIAALEERAAKRCVRCDGAGATLQRPRMREPNGTTWVSEGRERVGCWLCQGSGVERGDRAMRETEAFTFTVAQGK